MNDNELDFLQHSNWIEGEISSRALDDAIRAWKYAKKIKKLKISSILQIHYRLLVTLRPDIAGQFRTCDVAIGGVVKPMELPYVMEQKVKNWIEQCFENKKTTPKESHIKFEYLHPFEDGNGRVGRILYNLERINKGKEIHIIKEEDRFKYYKWFK